MILPVSVVAVIFLFSYFASVRNQSFFSLINGKREKDSVTGQHFLHKDFYKCSRTAKCTHVVKYVKSSKYEMVYSKEAIQNITGEIMVWEKICESLLLHIKLCQARGVSLCKNLVHFWKKSFSARKSVRNPQESYCFERSRAPLQKSGTLELSSLVGTVQ